MRKASFVVGAAAVSIGGVALAGETVTYSYDALGRLVEVSTKGGPNDGVSVGTGYDPAGNRCVYTVASGGAVNVACTGGGGGGPPGNQPPVTVPDSLSVEQCESGTVNVTANDSDPEGNLPLTVTGVEGGAMGTASIESATTIRYTSIGGLGPDVITYTVADSLGATSTGTLNVSVTGTQPQVCG
jgi:hypothetical protein